MSSCPIWIWLARHEPFKRNLWLLFAACANAADSCRAVSRKPSASHLDHCFFKVICVFPEVFKSQQGRKKVIFIFRCGECRFLILFHVTEGQEFLVNINEKGESATWYHDRIQIEGTELPLNPLLLSKACNRRMAVFMVSCANSIPITYLFSYICWQEPSTVCWWLLSLASEPPASQRYSAFIWKEYSAVKIGITGLVCTLVQWSVISSEISAWHVELAQEERLVTWCEHYNINTGFGPPPKASASKRKLHSTKMFWALVFTHGSLSACSQYSCFPKWAAFLPCVCASWSGAGIVVKTVFYCSFILRIMICGFAVEF